VVDKKNCENINNQPEKQEQLCTCTSTPTAIISMQVDYSTALPWLY